MPPLAAGANRRSGLRSDARVHPRLVIQKLKTSPMGGGMGSGRMRAGMSGAGMGGMMPMMMNVDPKQQAEMMAMRGEMMKAMGDIMLKYAQRAQSSAK
jgi:hypothetical protein